MTTTTTTTTTSTLTTRELIARWPTTMQRDGAPCVLSDKVREALLDATSTRGKWKGYLLASAPSEYKRPRGYLAWQAIVANLAPSRVSTFAVIFRGDAFLELDSYLLKSGLAAALRAVEPDFRWSLYAYHHDTDAERTALAQWLDTHGGAKPCER